MNELQTKLEKIEQHLESIDRTLIVNTAHLAEHMRRTNIIERELKPVKEHVQQVRGAGKLLMYGSVVATIMATLFAVWGK